MPSRTLQKLEPPRDLPPFQKRPWNEAVELLADSAATDNLRRGVLSVRGHRGVWTVEVSCDGPTRRVTGPGIEPRDGGNDWYTVRLELEFDELQWSQMSRLVDPGISGAETWFPEMQIIAGQCRSFVSELPLRLCFVIPADGA